MEMGSLFGLLSQALMLIVGILAFIDGKFFPSQMLVRHGVRFGFPLVISGAFWGNILILPTVFDTIGEYVNQWKLNQIVSACIIGCFLSLVTFRFLYTKMHLTNALTHEETSLSAAGCVMLLYTILTHGLLFLFFFCTHPVTSDLMLVGICLAVYIPIANHVVLEHIRSMYGHNETKTDSMKIMLRGEIILLLAIVGKWIFS